MEYHIGYIASTALLAIRTLLSKFSTTVLRKSGWTLLIQRSMCSFKAWVVVVLLFVGINLIFQKTARKKSIGAKPLSRTHDLGGQY